MTRSLRIALTIILVGSLLGMITVDLFLKIPGLTAINSVLGLIIGMAVHEVWA